MRTTDEYVKMLTEKNYNSQGVEEPAEKEEPPEKEENRAMHVLTLDDLRLDKRSKKACWSLGIHSVAQLCSTTPSQLQRVDGVGRYTVRQIVRALAGHALELAHDPSYNSMKKPTPAKERGSAGWTEERRKAQSRRAIQMNKERREHAKAEIMEQAGDNFVEAMEMAIATGAIPAARSLLDCCTPLMAKKIIDLVSAIEKGWLA
tara:strand:+ start:735 stop:1346 length:612 start_codon:yes stop_codon:yes gene_type:complete